MGQTHCLRYTILLYSAVQAGGMRMLLTQSVACRPRR